MNPINFQPLARMEQIRVAGQSVDLAQPKYRIFLNLPLLDRLAVLLFIAAGIAATIFLGGFGIILFLLIPSYFYSKKLNNQEKLIWQAFAIANGWQIFPAGASWAFVPPSLRTTGHSHKVSDNIVGTLANAPFRLFDFQYTIGNGKNAQTFKTTVFLFQMDRVDLPDLLLRSSAGLANDPKPGLSERLNLEGDFNKFFKVFAEPGKEVESFVILTPDVMQFLVTNGHGYDIETFSLGLAVYSRGDYRRQDKLPGLIDFGIKLHAQIMQNLPLANHQPTSPVAAATGVPGPTA